MFSLNLLILVKQDRTISCILLAQTFKYKGAPNNNYLYQFFFKKNKRSSVQQISKKRRTCMSIIVKDQKYYFVNVTIIALN